MQLGRNSKVAAFQKIAAALTSNLMTMFCGSESRLMIDHYLPNHAHQNVIIISARNKRIQWNPSIAATLGEQHFGRYIGVVFIEGLFCTNCSFGTWVPGRYIAVGLYSGVARR